MEENRMPSRWGKRVEKADGNKFGYVDVALDKLTINGPTVLCLGGQFVVGRRSANGFSKFVYNLINTNPQDRKISVFSLMYGSYDNRPMEAHVSDEEYETIINTTLMPLISSGGKKIDTITAQKNMRNLTIVAHCFGTEVANKLSHMLQEKMVELTCFNQEIASILKQVTNICYAPYRLQGFPLFSVVDFYSMQDRHMRYFPKIEKMNKDMFATTQLNSKNNHLLVVAQSLLKDYGKTDIFDEHMIDLLKRDENWQLKAMAEQKQGDKEKFSRANALSVGFGFCIAESVSNSIENTRIEKLIELDLVKIQKSVDYIIREQTKFENEKEEKELNQ